MEIERKYLVTALPAGCRSYPSHAIEQAYLCTEPVVRIRRQDDDYILTYKSKGLLAREEYNLPLTREAYGHLLAKADGVVLIKRRYLIPLADARAMDGGRAGENADARAADGGSDGALTVELDVFSGRYEGLMLAEVEFPDKEQALAFTPPAWFGEDVTFSGEYQNSRLSRG